MRSRVRMLVVVACLAVFCLPFAYAVPGRNKNKEEKLVEKIEREKNPGKKARLQIKLAKLKLSKADEAYRHRNFARGRALLQQYLEQVKISWTTLQSANGAVKKHLRAFKKLEISLGEDERYLEDLRRSIPYTESEFVKQIEKESSAVHTEVLEALFPRGFSPGRKSKRSTPPKSSVAAKAGAAKS